MTRLLSFLVVAALAAAGCAGADGSSGRLSKEPAYDVATVFVDRGFGALAVHADRIGHVRTTGGTARSIDLGERPGHVAALLTHGVVTSADSNRVWKLDLASLSTVASIGVDELSGGATDVVVLLSGVYVAGVSAVSGRPVVVVLDRDTLETTAVIDLPGDGLPALATNPVEVFALVPGNSWGGESMIVRIDTRTNRIGGSATVDGLVIDPSCSVAARIWTVAVADAEGVSLFDPSTLRMVERYALRGVTSVHTRNDSILAVSANGILEISRDGTTRTIDAVLGEGCGDTDFYASPTRGVLLLEV